MLRISFYRPQSDEFIDRTVLENFALEVPFQYRFLKQFYYVDRNLLKLDRGCFDGWLRHRCDPLTGPQLLQTVRDKLLGEVEGTCSGKHGFVINVTGIDNIGAGLIQPGQ